MFGAIAVLFVLPWLDRSPVRSSRFRPLYKQFFWVLAVDAIAPGFRMLAGSVGPSHAHVHLVTIAEEVVVHGMRVRPDDLVHADRHGAVVIPRAAAHRVPENAARIARREAVIIAAAKEPGFDVDRLEAAMGEAEDIH